MHFIESRANLYLGLVSAAGIVVFILLSKHGHFDTTLWPMIFTLAGATLLLNHIIFELPPEGNRLSMDSSIYLASLFLYGLELTLTVLIIFSIVFMFSNRKTEWWKHVFNFALYTFMITNAFYVFDLTGGLVGSTEFTNLFPYIGALSVYFITNVALIAIYFLLGDSIDSIEKVLKGMIKGTLATYITTLLLSFVLVIIIDSQKIFGLFLFVSMSALLSVAFKQHIELYKVMSDKANKDHLTGLNNHGYFKELLEKHVFTAKETERPLSIALLDLDDFKKYNDLYGHILGDHLLKDFGTLLELESKTNDFIVARYGGEEFSIIMPDTSRDRAYAFMNELRKKTNDTFFKGVEALPYGCLSFSAGIAEWENQTYSVSEFLNNADQAMYAAKDQGKNLVQVFKEHSDYSVQRSLNLEKDLEEAEQQLKIFLSKDVYTYRHSKRVYQYAVDFSKKLNLSDYDRKTLILGAIIHDIGKLEIPRDILNKKGKLEPHEWEMMKKHVTWGKEIISTNKKLEDLIPLVELHHERYEGNGYPYGLKGKTIPKLARILCIIDSFDAMTTERPYQKTKTFEEAIVELRACAGKQFDPQYVEPFIEMIKQEAGLDREKVV
ncbi:HD family phosphohydrolase [Bacillus sp. FJAT-18017]|uniref:bifunctional diguanylate cyclase/phosphohydrolase n=1 Tax=Bacillus sp. FJAT-18017 TaxID=1705566 RepID=UPI0006ADFBAD|nr:diguanylate cyclase [Bacillus sp. FJAT-18017]ALC88811.1 HD family phosphohydrolase [Bacillus sp. FJAT-18017]